MALSPGTTLGRYKIISSIGAGGMGEVYRAEDTLLRRQIAIKVLPQQLSNNPEALKRFQKEAKALAALNHSNVLLIHDFLSENSFSFVVMELLEGETLRAHISESKLQLQKVVEIAIQIAEGLAAAHSKGIVHRDLKPENILLTSGDKVKIVDFGLARLHTATAQDDLSEEATASQMTETGIVKGTVPYMSPEQVRGEHVDERSDIFSFGCVLYEMLSGKRPFAGKTSAETAASILRDEPNKLSDIPPELERILQHCLEKNPEHRFHSAYDLALELKDIGVSSPKIHPILSTLSNKTAVIVMIILLALISVIGLRQKFANHSAAEKIQSLAVLPLKNLSTDPNQEFFADGMTEELIAKLAGISALRVISRTSIMEYKGASRKSLPQIAKELNVDAIMEGSVMRSGDRIRITAQLIYAPTDKHLWAESYERDLTDILGLQNEVASTIAREIRIKLTPQESAQLSVKAQVKPAAFEAYLRGINYWRRARATKEELHMGITMFDKAIEIDSNFAPAYAELSRAYSRMYFTSQDRTEEILSKAKKSAVRALEIQPELPEGHLALGFYYYYGFRNYGQALQEFSIAKKSVPNNVDVLSALAAVQKRLGNLQAALEGNKRILELAPRDAPAAIELGILSVMVGEHANAQRYFDLAISLRPDNSGIYQHKVNAYLKWTGDTKGARNLIMKIPGEEGRKEYLQVLEMLNRNYQAALDILPLNTVTSYENAILAGDCYRLMNLQSKARASYGEARLELAKLLENDPRDGVLHTSISIAYAGLNRKEDAIREAKRAVELLPISKDAVLGPWPIHKLAIVYVMVGEYDLALDQIEYLLSIPTALTLVSVPMLRIDPTWDPLRSHPRFQKILAQP